MKDYLSPAFYLTPPMDTGTPNVIYINPAASYQGLELFTTLAHEGFPGHLYQTVTFERQNPSGIRNLLCTSGFAEGWATYIEPFAYQYAAGYIKDPSATELARISWLNRSINLCMYSLLDIEIHYNGWTQAEAASFLKAFGIEEKHRCLRNLSVHPGNPRELSEILLGLLKPSGPAHLRAEPSGPGF